MSSRSDVVANTKPLQAVPDEFYNIKTHLTVMAIWITYAAYDQVVAISDTIYGQPGASEANILENIENIQIKIGGVERTVHCAFYVFDSGQWLVKTPAGGMRKRNS